MDRRYLRIISDFYAGRSGRIETISAALSEPRDALEDVVDHLLIPRVIQRARRRRGT